MRSEHTPPALIILVALLLVGAGLFFGHRLDQRWSREASTIAHGARSEAEPSVFRDWLWERRGLDLLIQVALIFAGTLGVAAILPNTRELLEPPPPRTELEGE
jgi:hypothetical protein